MSTYNQNYYFQNRKKISLYNRKRREENPQVIENERKSYKLKVEDFKIRSKIQNLRGRLAFESLNIKKQKEIMDLVNTTLDI